MAERQDRRTLAHTRLTPQQRSERARSAALAAGCNTVARRAGELTTEQRQAIREAIDAVEATQ